MKGERITYKKAGMDVERGERFARWVGQKMASFGELDLKVSQQIILGIEGEFHPQSSHLPGRKGLRCWRNCGRRDWSKY